MSINQLIFSRMMYNENVKILVFIPMYNCAPQIARVLNRLVAYKDYFHSILLVDNKSQDQTASVAQATAQSLHLQNLTILINNQNINLGGSHKVAFDFALKNNFTHLVVLHGDDQADFSDLVTALHQKESPVDAFLGARFLSESKLIGYSKFRICGNLVLNVLCSLVCRRKIFDMGSGLNMYSAKFLQDKRYLSFPNDLTFNVFLLFHTCRNNYSLNFFPLTWREEDQVSNAKVFRQMSSILKLCFKTLMNRDSIYSHRPIKEYAYEIYYQV
jgi:dolichol-phosphate mannosyltransferase